MWFQCYNFIDLSPLFPKQVRKILNWRSKSIKINFKSHYYHLNLFIITIFAVWRISFQTICPPRISTRCFKVMSGVWNLLLRWNGGRDLSAGNVGIPISAQERPLFLGDVPNARPKNRPLQGPFFTIASFPSARHFTLPFRYAREMRPFRLMSLPEDSRYGRWPAGISNRRSARRLHLWRSFPKGPRRMSENFLPTKSAECDQEWLTVFFQWFAFHKHSITCYFRHFSQFSSL